jgi:hypothetical protein
MFDIDVPTPDQVQYLLTAVYSVHVPTFLKMVCSVLIDPDSVTFTFRKEQIRIRRCFFYNINKNNNLGYSSSVF